MSTHAQTVVAITTAILAEDHDAAMDVINALDPLEARENLYAACFALAGAWHVDAVELGMTDAEMAQSLGLAVARREGL